MTDLVRNIQYAALTLSNSLGTTTVIVATLGIAIGALTVIFSVIDCGTGYSVSL